MEKEITFEDIQRVNNECGTIDVKGKEYVLVNERIKAFRMIYPDGCIETEMIYHADHVVVFKAIVSENILVLYEDGRSAITKKILGTGYAEEKEGSSFINKTSYIENCETSAVGRALAMCGIGIDTSIASYEEVANAVKNQGKKSKKIESAGDTMPCTKQQQLSIQEAYTSAEIQTMLTRMNLKKIDEISFNDAQTMIENRRVSFDSDEKS